MQQLTSKNVIRSATKSAIQVHLGHMTATTTAPPSMFPSILKNAKFNFFMIILCVKILLDRLVQSSCHSVIDAVYQRPKTSLLIL